MSAERWAPVPGWHGSYEVSDQGRVRSLDRVIHHGCGDKRVKGRPLAIRLNRYGYPVVALYARPYIKHCTVHALVLAAFVGRRPDGAVARHLNGVRTDCRLENLVYGTYSENQLDRRRHGTDPNANRTHCVHGHAFAGDNVRIRGNRRFCRTCVRNRTRAYKERKALAG